MAKNFKDEAMEFLTAETVEADSKEIGLERIDLPEGYVLRPETKSKHLHILIQPSVYDALKVKQIDEGYRSFNDFLNAKLRDIAKG